MLNEERIRQAVDTRLSGMSASEARRMRIRAAVHQERREVKPVRNTKTLVIAIALIAVMLTSAIAVAETLNLFDTLTCLLSQNHVRSSFIEIRVKLARIFF